MKEQREKKTEKNSAADFAERVKRSRFMKFFEKFDLREENRIAQLGKWTVFALMIIVEFVILLQFLDSTPEEDFFFKLMFVVVSSSVLTLSEAFKLFVAKNSVAKTICFIFDIISSITLIAATGSTYLSILYMLVLTEFYITEKRALASVLMLVVSIPAYLVSYWLGQTLWLGTGVSYMVIITDSVGTMALMVVHFFVVNFALGFYRQYVRLDKALKELDESKKELQNAYDELKAVTVLQERQRIAKDIHDTAGHSITTVIMQTEAAKLLIEKDPEAAKQKIVAANLQAKHALEELRESVHLLSGATGQDTLQTALKTIVNESTDGTGINIRHEFADLIVSPAKHRFLCNTLKESISNGLRHGGATAFWVELKEEDGMIVLTVSDNGKGADVATMQRGFGLTSMAEHAERLGGKVKIHSEEGEGLEIVVALPMDKGEEDGTH